MDYLIDLGIYLGISVVLALAVCRATRECAVKPQDKQQSQLHD